MKKPLAKRNGRATLIAAIYGVLFLLLFARFAYIQIFGVVNDQDLKDLASQKQQRIVELPADRGKIVDSKGETIVADTLSYRMFIVLSKKAEADQNGVLRYVEEKDYKKLAKVLSEQLSLDKDEVFQRLKKANKDNRYQVELGAAGKNLSHTQQEDIKEALAKENITGVNFLEEKKRFYPNGVFASHLIGYATTNEEEDENGQLKKVTRGKMGLEKTYDESLQGENGSINFRSDGKGYIFPQADKNIQPAKDGHDIQLTLNSKIQNILESTMTEVYDQYDPESIVVVLAHAKTGEILAMSQRPTFNPTTLEGLDANWMNEVVEKTIEPGSTMKMFTLAAAVEEGKWDPNAYFTSGQYRVFDRVINDVKRGGWGTISYLEGFQRSSNVSMAYLLEKIGDKRFIEYIREFGFGEKVGLGLPNEASGVIMDNYPAERLTTSYGQGSTVTPIQMIQAATAIANDGKMMKPYLIKSIKDPNTGKVLEENKPTQKGMPISPETAKEVREVLASTVTASHGTGRPFALNSYNVGGKTGTAEIPKGEGQVGYLSGRGNYLYSFLGMAPIEDPEIIAFVSVQQPELPWQEYGAIPVAKIFTTVMNNSLKTLQVQPNEAPDIQIEEVANFVGEPTEEVIENVRKDGNIPIVIGELEGEVKEQYPSEGSILPPKAHVLLKTEGTISIPDFTGWSKKMVLSYKALSGLDIRISGEGYVVAQSISNGTPIQDHETIIIQLESPATQYGVVEQKNNENEEEAEES